MSIVVWSFGERSESNFRIFIRTCDCSEELNESESKTKLEFSEPNYIRTKNGVTSDLCEVFRVYENILYIPQ